MYWDDLVVSVHSGEGLEVDANNKDKAGIQVCVDKKQLVRKNNSLPMEVTWWRKTTHLFGDLMNKYEVF